MGTPAKFKTRHHTIEAVQFDGTQECGKAIETWSDNELTLGASPYVPFIAAICVPTPDGISYAMRGLWIVKDSGGFWVCDDEIFQRKYEREAA